MILAGDIGGTNARLAVYSVKAGRLEAGATEIFPTSAYRSLEEMVRKFVASSHQRIEHACFGFAGPVHEGRTEGINLAWTVEATSLAAELGLPQVRLINDLEANAYGIDALGPADLETLNRGDPDARGNATVIAAGTGLGEAGLYWDGRNHRPYATEGGHTDFSPRNDLEIELLRYLANKFDHVSWERVVSGPGLHNIYEFLRDTGRGEEPQWLAAELHAGDAPAVISRAGLKGECAICVAALNLFATLYAAEAGNLALKTMARGGVFIGGGIAPKILSALKRPEFVAAFVDKGRLRSLLQTIPLRVILNDMTALLGAARCAALEASLL